MKCTVVLLVVTVLVGFARAAPQRGIDFLPGADEEFPAEVKPVIPEEEQEEQEEQEEADQDEQQQQQQEVFPLDEEQRSVTEVPATVEPVEDEQQTEDPLDETTEQAQDDEPEDEEQEHQEPEQQEILDTVTDQPEDTAVNTTGANETESSSTAAANVTTHSPPEEATSAKNEPTTTDSGVQLTTDPIVVAEPSSTESTDDGSQFAEDVNSLAEDTANRVGYGLEDNEEQTPVEPPVPVVPRPRPIPAKPKRPAGSTELPAFGAPPRVATASDEYDSKSLESNEYDDQEQLEVDPNEVQRTSTGGEEQFRSSLPSWFSSTPRFTGYEHWQPSFSQRPSSWQAPARNDRPRHYQPNGFDTAFHGHGFHRSSWH